MCRCLAWHRQRAGAWWEALGHWFHINSLSPAWLPQRWRRPLFGYLLAVVLTVLVLALEVWAVAFFPHIDQVSGILVFLLILFLAQNWGAGPGLLATGLGTFLLYYLIYPPRFAISWKDFVNMLQGGLVLFGGLFVAQAASHRENQRRAAEQRACLARQAQRQAEAVAASLAEVQATTERERQRLRAVLETLLAMVAALVQPESAAALPAEAGDPAEDVVSRRLAELTCHALGCREVRLFSLEQQTREPVLRAAVERSLEPALVSHVPAEPRVSSGAWLDAEARRRLGAGELVQVDLRQGASQRARLPASRAHQLVAPIRRGNTLLGLLVLDAPWATSQVPAESRVLVRAITELGALLIEREHLLCEREAARAEALRLFEAKRHLEIFLGIVSHELRTPLTSILLGVESGQRSLERVIQQQPDGAAGDDKNSLVSVQRRLGIVYRQSKRLERLVEELLECSHIEAGQFTLRQEPLDLAAFVHQRVEEQRALTPDRTISLHLSLDQPLSVYADAGRIGQVLSSYLSNALKYSTEEYPVEVGVREEEQQALVWVQDAGPGIPATFQTSLWQRFYRVPGVEILSGSGVGLGLGLYISRTIIEQHQGQVGVQSEPGNGSRFWFTLPLVCPTKFTG